MPGSARNLLLDTHAALWWWDDSPLLSARAKTAVADATTTVYFSSVSAMEIATKARLGKLEVPGRLARDLAGAVALSGWREMPLGIGHAQRAGGLEWSHRDPFDRMLLAQAEVESLILVTRDGAFQDVEIETLW